MKPASFRIALALLFPLAVAATSEGQHIEELHKAVSEKHVSARARGLGGYSSVHLEILNLTDRGFYVDTAGSCLIPASDGYQRLGLGSPTVQTEDGKGRLIALPPRGRWDGIVNSCCMDKGKASPSQGLWFQSSPRMAPDTVYRTLRMWASCPKLQQSDVNAVIWGDAKLPELEEKAKSLGIVQIAEFCKSRMQADGGKVYWLSPDGTLYVGTGTRGCWSEMDSGVEEFTAGFGEVLTFSKASTAMKRYNQTERKWEEWDLPRKPRNLVPCPGGSIYALSENGNLYVRRQGESGFCGAGGWINDLAITPRAVKPLVFAVQGSDAKLAWKQDAGPDWSSMRSSGVSGIGATSSALYVSDRRGVHRYCGRWTCIAGPQFRFAAGDKVCYLHSGTVLKAYSDRTKAATDCPPLPEEGLILAVDRTSDDLFFADSSGNLRKLGEGMWLDLGSVPAKKAAMPPSNLAQKTERK